MAYVLITAFAKATLYNLWHNQWACADCIEWRWKGEACPAMRATFPVRSALMTH
jgi:hypothetical protein